MRTLRYSVYITFALLTGCHHSSSMIDPIAVIQIQDRNGLTETVSAPERLENYNKIDFLSPQPYKKILRVYKKDGKNHSKITTYYPNGNVWQYLEAKELRAYGDYKEWFPNGQIKIEATVIGGTADVIPGSQSDWLFDGICHVWDEQGNLLAAMPYSKGSLEGISVYYYHSGQIEKELPFHKHVLEGVATEYYPSNRIKSKTAYNQGKKTGSSFGYFQNGQVSWEESYRDDLILQGSYYTPRGELIAEVTNGSGFQAIFSEEQLSALVQIQQGSAEGGVKQFNPKGDLHSIYHVKNGRKVGEEVIYFSSQETNQGSPQPKISLEWNDHLIHGTVKTWYSTGSLQSQKEYCHNKKTGPSIAWYKDGSLMLVEEYEEDKLIKGQYYKKNAIDSISSIVKGTGIATLYDENGVFLRKITYDKGDPVIPDKD